ncbi:hypothetical protein TeGR_g2090 [Tetraparma gracilis]|uniref:Uncharacterized protein n=1 Tax=Tetraparma gracilis TaxID=2962635 RepID=A0ABQ6MIP5_9STRA|nr:hypothetical protein TeGR_g2090 [Tetraparma gracilis]
MDDAALEDAVDLFIAAIHNELLIEFGEGEEEKEAEGDLPAESLAVKLALVPGLLARLARSFADGGMLGRGALLLAYMLIIPRQNKLAVVEVPGQLARIACSPHREEALLCVKMLTRTRDAAVHAALVGSGPLLDLLAGSAGTDPNATWALGSLCHGCGGENLPALFAHPGLVAALVGSVRAAPDCAEDAAACLFFMSARGELKAGVARHEGVVAALVHVLDAPIPAAVEYATKAFFNLSISEENRGLLAADGRVVRALGRYACDEGSHGSAARFALFCSCWAGEHLPPPEPNVTLLSFLQAPFRNHLAIVEGFVRESPGCLGLTSGPLGLTPLDLARASALGDVLPLLAAAQPAFARGHSLVHAVGYPRGGRAAARAARAAVMLCLRRLAARAEGSGERGARARKRARRADERDREGELNAGKALDAYMGGGGDVWSVILGFAF